MFRVTRDWIFSNRTRKGAWKAKQLLAIGVPWPPEHGWIDRVDGTLIDEEKRRIFENLNGDGPQLSIDLKLSTVA